MTTMTQYSLHILRCDADADNKPLLLLPPLDYDYFLNDDYDTLVVTMKHNYDY